MNGQLLMNIPITVHYVSALKNDRKGGRRGTAAERLSAERTRNNDVLPTCLTPATGQPAYGVALHRPPCYSSYYSSDQSGTSRVACQWIHAYATASANLQVPVSGTVPIPHTGMGTPQGCATATTW
ncbi:hypothetical protein BC827DRAFT_263570 [Russula dissimulans]|nr:hypothetical protein BC827DRAFT_263570 [Russula dissimulans]